MLASSLPQHLMLAILILIVVLVGAFFAWRHKGRFRWFLRVPTLLMVGGAVWLVAFLAWAATVAWN